MTWKDDTHGKLFKPAEAKLYAPTHKWAMKLSQLDRQKGRLRIVTTALPDDDVALTVNGEPLGYVERIFVRRPRDIDLLAGPGTTSERLLALKIRFPEIRVARHPTSDVRIVLIAPDTVYVGADFGLSRRPIVTLGTRSADAHDWYVHNVFDPLWREADVL